MTVDISFHYPSDLLNNLIQAIPLLSRGKEDTFLFFQSAGVAESIMASTRAKWYAAPKEVKKIEIVREILTKLNEGGERLLRERREVLRRVVEFEAFDACYPENILKAKGYIATIKSLTELKDSATKIIRDQEKQRQEKIQQSQREAKEVAERLNAIENVRQRLFALFGENNPQRRGKMLEGVLNDLFKVYGISVREAFTLRGNANKGIVEQIDGVIELDGHLYFAEMKWWDTPLGRPEMSEHLTRVFFRADARGLIISASSFSEPAISICKEALQQKVVILATLQEFVHLLENKTDLCVLLKKKVHAAVIDKNPFI